MGWVFMNALCSFLWVYMGICNGLLRKNYLIAFLNFILAVAYAIKTIKAYKNIPNKHSEDFSNNNSEEQQDR